MRSNRINTAESREEADIDQLAEQLDKSLRNDDGRQYGYGPRYSESKRQHDKGISSACAESDGSAGGGIKAEQPADAPSDQGGDHSKGDIEGNHTQGRIGRGAEPRHHGRDDDE